ncbi:MAG: phosphoadenylyl-sulfate reductase [Candidatus Lutacidiplasmatales archaeon]
MQGAYGPLEAAEWSRELEGEPAAEIVRRAVERFGDGLVLASAFGKDSLVILDLARRWRPGLPVLFLDTGYHFPETLAFRDRLRTEWGANILDIRPLRTVAQQDAALAPHLYARDPDRCCALRKVDPLHRALQGKSAWLSGLRRTQHPSRAQTPIVEWQELPGGGGVFKVHPLAGWTLAEVEAYLEQHDVPRHPLWARGYPSVGCAPCTQPASVGDGERSGRWKGIGKVECGIHRVGLAGAEGSDARFTGPERA